MKRDIELARKILFVLEKIDYTGNEIELNGTTYGELSEYEEREIDYHIMLLHEGGLIRAFESKLGKNGQPFWRPISLTWAGHEFLDLARSDNIWNKAIGQIKSRTVAVSYEVAKAALIKITMDTIFPGSA